MSAIQVKEAEVIANEISKKNDKVFAKETPLAQAKAIQGLRAVFDEVCPFFPYQKKKTIECREFSLYITITFIWTLLGLPRPGAGSGNRCISG